MHDHPSYIGHIQNTIKSMHLLDFPSPLILTSHRIDGKVTFILTARFGSTTMSLEMNEDQALELSNGIAAEVELWNHMPPFCECDACNGAYN